MGAIATIGERTTTAPRSMRSTDLRAELATLDDVDVLAERVAELQDVLAVATRRLALLARAAQVAAAASADELIDLPELARLIQRSRSWIEHHRAAIPGRRQTTPGGKVRWVKREVLRWLRTGSC